VAFYYTAVGVGEVARRAFFYVRACWCFLYDDYPELD
jgi:hypothetical protein